MPTETTTFPAHHVLAKSVKGEPPIAPTRNPLNGKRRFNFRAKAASLKNGRTIRCESLMEAKATRMFEVLGQVQSYSEQPTPLQLKIGKVWSRYTPDFFVQWKCGQQWLVEVKPAALASTEAWRRKLAVAGVAAFARGMHFVLLTELHIDAAGLAGVDRVLASRHRQYIEDLGVQRHRIEERLARRTEEQHVLRVLARAFAASPSVRACQTLGIAYAFPDARLGATSEERAS